MNTFIDKLLSVIGYFFSPIPGSNFHYYTLFLIVAGALALLALGLKLYMKKYGSENKAFKRLFHTLPYQLTWVVTFFLLNLFGRYERFPLLGARFVLYITVLASIYLLGKSLYTLVKVYPAEKNRFRETPSQKKYMIGKSSRR